MLSSYVSNNQSELKSESNLIHLKSHKRMISILLVSFFLFFFPGKLRVNVLFIGMPGSGKSSTINILLGKKNCKSGQTFSKRGITQENKKYELDFQIKSLIELGKIMFTFTSKRILLSICMWMFLIF